MMYIKPTLKKFLVNKAIVICPEYKYIEISLSFEEMGELKPNCLSTQAREVQKNDNSAQIILISIEFIIG